MAKRSTKRLKTTSAPMRAVVTEEVRQQRIAQRAYERFVSRGCMHGHDVDDWLAAEAEVDRA